MLKGGLSALLVEATRLGLTTAPAVPASAPVPVTGAAADSKLSAADSNAGSSSSGGSGSGSGSGSAKHGPFRSAHSIALWRKQTALRIKAEAIALTVHTLTEESRLLSVTDMNALNARLNVLTVMADHTERLTRPLTIAAVLKRLTAPNAQTQASHSDASGTGSSGSGGSAPVNAVAAAAVDSVVIHRQIQTYDLNSIPSLYLRMLWRDRI